MTAQAWTVRRLTPADVDEVLAIQRASPEAAQWRAADYQQAEARGVTCLVAEQGTRLAGFLAGRAAGDQFEILNLAVRPEARRRGAGAALLKEALRLASASTRKVFLEVRESNRAAREFYARHGFTEAGRRARYYANPVEDALILSRVLV